ncbi:MAG: SPFH domain-containing protein [Flavobacteriaceae bacterium]|jgi:membrane protease subunit (stomatin/prohibitin family)|nr:SPFH domain-containing protein [Flavobacteriaceae bacterium]
MGLFGFFKKQLATVIEWNTPQSDTVWYLYPSKTDEIKNASKLIVAPGQGCVLVYEGKIKDVLLEEGVYSLETDNHPFITTLLNMRQLFESEHKLHVFFFRQAQFVNQNWGTPSQVKYVDPVYQMPVAMGINGNFSYRITNIEYFYRDIIGNENSFRTDDVKEIVVNRFMEQITSYLSAQKISYHDIDANLSTISTALKGELNGIFVSLGLELTDFRITGTMFDSGTLSRINKVADLSSDAKAAEVAGLTYVELEKLKALRDAARNEGGLAGAGLQIGTGLELGKQFAEQTEKVINSGSDDAMERLRKLNLLLQEGIITTEDFEIKKQELLKQI